jgi:sulfur-oxidizing protein SoxY
MESSENPMSGRARRRRSGAGLATPPERPGRRREPGRAAIGRRALLRGAAALGSVALLGGPGQARAQGNLSNLEPEEPVAATLKRLFGGRPIRDAGGAIKLELPLIAENGAQVPMAVEVQSPMTPQSYVKHIWIISDKNRRPLNMKVALTPAMGQAYVGANLRLGESTDVRAVAELSDDTLIMARRAVKVTVGGCGG